MCGTRMEPDVFGEQGCLMAADLFLDFMLLSTYLNYLTSNQSNKMYSHCLCLYLKYIPLDYNASDQPLVYAAHLYIIMDNWFS